MRDVVLGQRGEIRPAPRVQGVQKILGVRLSVAVRGDGDGFARGPVLLPHEHDGKLPAERPGIQRRHQVHHVDRLFVHLRQLRGGHRRPRRELCATRLVVDDQQLQVHLSPREKTTPAARARIARVHRLPRDVRVHARDAVFKSHRRRDRITGVHEPSGLRSRPAGSIRGARLRAILRAKRDEFRGQDILRVVALVAVEVGVRGLELNRAVAGDDVASDAVAHAHRHRRGGSRGGSPAGTDAPRAPSVVAVREPGPGTRLGLGPVRLARPLAVVRVEQRVVPLELHVEVFSERAEGERDGLGEGLGSLRGGRSACDARGGHELVRLQATHQAGLRGNRSGRRGRGGWAKNGTGEGKTRSETTVGGAADGRRAG